MAEQGTDRTLPKAGDLTVPPIPTVMGRPTVYTKELGEEICERIANGESLRTICKEDNMPERKSIHNWLFKYPDFLHHYEESRELQADTYADEMEDIARDETIDVQRARLIVDTRKWVSSKLKPKKYGDKIDHTTDGKALPTPIITLPSKD